MKKLHIIVTVALLAAALPGLLLRDNSPAQLISLSALALTAVLQVMFIGKHGRSRLLRLDIAAAGLVLMLVQCGLCGAAMLTEAFILAPLCVLLVVLLILSRIPQKEAPQKRDPDPDGTIFTRTLTEMMDTISRATAERDCGIATQMLYEQARFSEPCLNRDARTTERSILSAITEMHPDDTDEQITQKCNAILKLMQERSRYF